MNISARVVRLAGDPLRTDAATTRWAREVLPLLREQEGFLGASLVGNRTTGDGLTLTYWENERAMQNGRPQVRPVAQIVLGETGVRIIEDDNCEVVAQERMQPLTAGAFVRVTTFEADPARAVDNTAYFTEKVLPVIRAQPGARTALLFVNAASGRTIAVSGWSTERDLRNSEARIAPLRDAATAGGTTKVEVFEVYVTETGVTG